MKKVGKKGLEWQQAKRQLINDLKKTGEYNIIGQKVFGKCKDCQKYKKLTPDHKKKRSQGGNHTNENIDWVCIPCHNQRDNMGDKQNKKELKTKKANWMLPHKCSKCKKDIPGMLICPGCGQLSV